MAKDVHQAIRNVLMKEQNLSEEDAEAYLKQMKKINVINAMCTNRKWYLMAKTTSKCQKNLIRS